MNIIRNIFLLFLLAGQLTSALAQAATDTGKLRLLFVGDVMGHRPQIKSAEILKDKVFDYDPCWQYVKPVISKADLAIANLEVTLPGKPPYQGYPQFRSPDDLAESLRLAGFDLLLTANNHSNDAGKEGVINTIETLHSVGLYHTGTFRNAMERSLYYPLLIYKKGFKLAFLNYTYDTNGLKTVSPTIVNEIDEALIQADMAEAKALKPDAIIVAMHWGLEYQLKEGKKERELARKLIDWGADLIIGSHPHVIQPIKIEKGLKEDRTALVAYSLGNFISNQNKPFTDGGIMLEVELQKHPEQAGARVTTAQYIPVWRYISKSEAGKTSYHVLPASAFIDSESPSLSEMKEEDRKAMKKFLVHTRNHLGSDPCSEKKIDFPELETTLLKE